MATRVHYTRRALMPIDQIKRREFITLLGGMRGGRVAARGAGAAAGDAGDRVLSRKRPFYGGFDAGGVRGGVRKRGAFRRPLARYFGLGAPATRAAPETSPVTALGSVCASKALQFRDGGVVELQYR
jgi:hypothetical protein